MPDMSGTQKWSRCSRHTSRNICRHSLRGSIDRRMRSRSIQPLLRDGVLGGRRRFALGFGLAIGGDGAQPLAFAHDERGVVRGEREAVGLVHQRFGAQRREIEDLEPARALPCVRRGRARRRSAAPSRATLSPATPAICPKRFSGTGNGAMRRSIPSRSTRTAAALAVRLRRSLAARSSSCQAFGRRIERRRARLPAARSGTGARRAGKLSSNCTLS